MLCHDGLPSTGPTIAPTSSSPTLLPTNCPTELYARDLYGNPIFPTNPSGNEVLATNENNQPVVPRDNFGNRVYPATRSPITTVGPSIIDADLSKTGASSDESSAEEDRSMGETVLVSIIVAVLLVLVAVVVALLLVMKSRKAAGIREAFDNPLYSSSLAMDIDKGGHNDNSVAGYVDIPPTAPNRLSVNDTYTHVPNAETTGYLDISIGNEDEVDFDDV